MEERSSIGRLGLQVQNAGFIDAGFHGQITLELENQSGFPIDLKKGVWICQIVFVQMSRSAERRTTESIVDKVEPLQGVWKWIRNLHKLIFVRQIYLIFGA